MTWPTSGPSRVARRVGAALIDALGLCVSWWFPSPELVRFRQWHRSDPAGLHAAIGLPKDRCTWCR